MQCCPGAAVIRAGNNMQMVAISCIPLHQTHASLAVGDVLLLPGAPGSGGGCWGCCCCGGGGYQGTGIKVGWAGWRDICCSRADWSAWGAHTSIGGTHLTLATKSTVYTLHGYRAQTTPRLQRDCTIITTMVLHTGLCTAGVDHARSPQPYGTA